MLVARRLVVHSAEDVGMADPRALQIATSAMYALEKIGYPEAMIPLSEAIVYVCEAEKSNSVVNAMYSAKADAINTRDDNIPPYLKDNSKGSAEDKAQSKNYKYLDVDGIRVQFEDGWALVRASNTGPNLTIRFEANTTARLDEIKNEFEGLVRKIMQEKGL